MTTATKSRQIRFGAVEKAALSGRNLAHLNPNESFGACLKVKESRRKLGGSKEVKRQKN